MRTKTQRFFAFVLSTALGGAAFAVPATTPWSVQPKEPAALRGGHLFFRFPVTWEITRSGFNTLDVALEAETFVESWAIHRVSALESYLLTPRGRARVTTLTLDEHSPVEFDTLVLSETQFVQLLGVTPIPSEATERKILIQLPVAEPLAQNLILTANPRYFISVRLNLSFSP